MRTGAYATHYFALDRGYLLRVGYLLVEDCTMTWTIWTRKLYTGDRADWIATYTNRGHALARLRGLRRAAWRAGSEMEYGLYQG